MIASLARYWHTIRFLKPVQIYGRILFRLSRPAIDTRVATPPRRRQTAPLEAGPARAPSMKGPRTFTFLNETHESRAWSDPAREKLWLYNLHYFDDLVADDHRAREEWHRALVADWIRGNPVARGTGWEPYPTSLRIVNWIKWALRGGTLDAEAENSLATQARWLSRRVETHLLGNHLFVNAKALVFAGVFFDGAEARRWLDLGLAILDEQVPEQILEDGGQFELSPMYHALAVEDVVDLCAISAAFRGTAPPTVPPRELQWRGRIPAMLRWLDAMTHPDGGIGFFNDAALGIAPSLGELNAYASRIGVDTPAPRPPKTHLRQSGYVRVDAGEVAVILDVAPVGPDYQPGHAHADTLSFELSLFGQRLFVNSGTSVYGNSAERQRQRSTRAHNTVEIDGADSSEVWAGFRVARRARPRALAVSSGDDTVVSCEHDGYLRLAGRPVHRREWRVGSHSVEVIDTIAGAANAAVARLYIHPAIEVSGDGALTFTFPNRRTAQLSIHGGRVDVMPATWHPRFGESVPTRCVVIRLDASTLRCDLQWA